MSEKIPTVAFDPQRHVIGGRETSEGREVWFTLSDVVAAERPIEAKHEAVAIDDLKREIDAIRSQPLDTSDLERRIVQMFETFTPPPALTQETAAVLTDLTQAVLKLKHDQAETTRRVDVLASSIVAVGERLGV
jgi:hypothetical protein